MTAIYTIMVTNHGPSNVSGALVTDDLPNELSLNGAVNCSLVAPAACNVLSGGSELVNVEIDLPAGQSLTINIPVIYSTNSLDYLP